MKSTKSERHHWWPETVSRHWKDQNGGITRISLDGEEVRLKPKNIAVIGNGHFIKLGKGADETTPWDQNFENVFTKADDHFPTLVNWLNSLEFKLPPETSAETRFQSEPISGDNFKKMIESIVSLAIRSPMNREACVGLAEKLRGPLPERERNALIAVNMRDMHKNAIASFGDRGKVAILHSPYQELIYGDGFYHNLTSPSGPPSTPEILVPITPKFAILYVIPMMYSQEPRISKLTVSKEEAIQLNEVVQIYSKDMLFYRSDKPLISKHFRSGRHLKFGSGRNIVENIIHSIPGVPPRDNSLDFLERVLGGD